MGCADCLKTMQSAYVVELPVTSRLQRNIPPDLSTAAVDNLPDPHSKSVRMAPTRLIYSRRSSRLFPGRRENEIGPDFGYGKSVSRNQFHAIWARRSGSRARARDQKMAWRGRPAPARRASPAPGFRSIQASYNFVLVADFPCLVTENYRNEYLTCLGRRGPPSLIAPGSSVQDGTSAAYFAIRPIAG